MGKKLVGHYEHELKRQPMEEKHSDSTEKKVLDIVVSKEGYDDSFLINEKTHQY